MAKTAAQVTDEEIIVYRAAAQRRQEQERVQQAQRIQRAWILAQQAAQLLRENFGAKEVILFGSLARRDFFHRCSDLDLAVGGVKNQDFWRAWSVLDQLDREFAIDLIDIQTVSPALKLIIDQEGLAL
ncbi:MAG TPA: nucleotidyltransferase domain-containing protein [Anaerolineae bacterium]|nr:nucleotidyltransferase domain-containing protein [Anaerolineae bacterium]